MRGWRVLAVLAAIVAQNSVRAGDLRNLATGALVAIPIAVAYGYLSWRFTRFVVEGDNLRIDSGILFRSQKQVPLPRLQAVDVVRPLLARALGLAELRLEVAGGGSDASLSYVSESEAHRLRAELLARAAGIDAQTPEAPEQVIVEVPGHRLVAATLLSLPVLAALLWLASSVALATVFGEIGIVGVNVPVLLGVGGYLVNEVIGRYGFTVARSPDGLRLRYGLLDTRAQTVPPGRVQAVQMVEPFLWRRLGWARLRVNIAGYGGGQEGGESGVLLPVGTREEVRRVLELVLPAPNAAEGDPRALALEPAPGGARWLAPLAHPHLGLGNDRRMLAMRDGRLRRSLILVPHERTQSVRLTQGPIQRRLGLATVHLDLPPGAFRAAARHRNAQEGRAAVEAQARRARTARRTALPDRWMRPTPSGFGLRETAAGDSVGGVRAEPELGSPDPAGTRAAWGFDPWSPTFVAQPYPVYAALRERDPVVWFPPTQQWLISRYDDVNALLRDRRLGRSYLHLASHAEMGHDPDPEHLAPFWRLVRNGMLDREPPDHTRLRRLVSAAFTARRVEQLRPRIEAIVEALVSDLLDAGQSGSVVDFKAMVAEPLPVAVIAEMLGVPAEDRHLLRPWSADMCGMYELAPSRAAHERAVRASVEFSDYLRGLSRQRRAAPGEDLVSALTQVVDAGDRLSEDELIGTCVLLLNAGHEATVNVTGNGWLALFRHPDQLARLRADPERLLPTAVEELMRYDTPLQMFERWVLEDIELRGHHIRRGSEVALLFGSANHDPTRFTAPQELDIQRADNPHISFGAGIHYCLGAPLGRIELQTSYAAVLRRVPRLALAAEPRWASGYIIRGLESLPVTTV
jgi:cytochrome P450/uncharacterized membrane protein YdbT with pleckstrin-like domain